MPDPATTLPAGGPALAGAGGPQPSLEAAAGTGPAPGQPARSGMGRWFWVSAGWLGLVALAALLAGVLPLPDPNETGVDLPNLNPSLGHLFGTDQLGRDLLARCVFGARVSLGVGLAAVTLAVVVGASVGLVSGYYRGRLDTVLMALTDVMLAFPALVFALALVTFLGQRVAVVILALGVLGIAPVARLVRGSTFAWSEREFIRAARALGAGDRRILVREVLPNVVPTILSVAMVGIAVAIVAEGSLAFLGLSVRPPTPTWGGMINEGRAALAQDPLISLMPAGVMFLTVLALNHVGDAVATRAGAGSVQQ